MTTQDKTTPLPPPIRQLLQIGHTNLPVVRTLTAGEMISAELLPPGGHALLVADAASLAAASPHVDPSLLAGPSLIFPAPAKPNMDGCIQELLQNISEQRATSIIVIGSGSLSDIGKYCAAQADLPLTIIATAPSMNGYTSTNASLMHQGLKQSFAAKMVDTLIISEDIIRRAPQPMQDAGRSDALASISADIDWHLSHLLLDTPYFPEIFAAQLPLFNALQDPMKLMDLLLIQGLGMTAAHSSAPASGGEHMLAHLYEMLQPETYGQMLHGELVGLIHPAYLAYQRRILASTTPPKLRAIPPATEVETFFGNHWHTIEPSYQQKKLQRETEQKDLQEKLNSTWPSIQQSLNAKLQAVDTIVSQLTIGGEYHDIPDGSNFYFLSRDRFTLLDLVRL